MAWLILEVGPLFWLGRISFADAIELVSACENCESGAEPHRAHWAYFIQALLYFVTPYVRGTNCGDKSKSASSEGVKGRGLFIEVLNSDICHPDKLSGPDSHPPGLIQIKIKQATQLAIKYVQLFINCLFKPDIQLPIDIQL